MKLPLEIFLALRHLRPRRTFVSAITFLSVFGVTLAVMVLIVVLSVMAGFERDLRDKVIGFNAHLILSNGAYLEDPSSWLTELAHEPGVLGAAPFISGPVVVNCHNRFTTPLLRGIDPEAEEKVLPIKKYLIAGDATLVGEAVLVGKEWAARNSVFIGDKIQVYAPRQLESLQHGGMQHGKVILPTELVVTGIFQTGLFDYDLNFMITSLENAAYLYNFPPGSVHGIAVRVTDPSKVEDLKRKLNALCVFPLQAKTWMDQNRSLFTAIATERVAMTFILFFIMIVAAFGLCSTLITVTVQKTREIGVLKALGATDGQVRGIFLLHGLIVGTVGSSLGVALAQLVLVYRNDFRQFLATHFGINIFSPDVYQFVQIPAEISPWLVFIIGLSGVVVCMLAALIPAQEPPNFFPPVPFVMSNSLLTLKDVEKSFRLGGNTVKIFAGLSAEFSAKELVTIQGASGTGKSTLLQLLGGLDYPDKGSVFWQGAELSQWSSNQLAQWRRDRVGLVFQSYHLLPELSAWENVELPAIIRGKSSPGFADELLKKVGLGERMDHRPAELSGGEQQRVAIARALRNQPQLILADEPTGNLDRATGEKVMTLFLQLCREFETTLVLVTHDSLLASLGDRRLLLESGLLQEL